MITINQRDTLPWHPGMTVAEVLDAMSYTFPHIVVSIDGVVVRHDAYAETPVPDDADVRMIHLMAGG